MPEQPIERGEGRSAGLLTITATRTFMREAICAPKSIMGHQLGAAGATTALFAVKALHEDVIPPTINIDNIRSEFRDLDIVRKARRKNIKVAVAFSAGFGGYNGVLVFKKYVP